MVKIGTGRRTGGRSARVRDAVLATTIDALARDAVDDVSIADVARAAGVHETSIYRRWGSRENLILEALLTFSSEQLPLPDTGSLRSDLLRFLDEAASYLASPLGQALTRAMAAASSRPDIADSRDKFWRTRRAIAAEILHRAVERREIASGLDADLILELLVAPLHFRALLSQQPLDHDFTVRVVDQLIAGIPAP